MEVLSVIFTFIVLGVLLAVADKHALKRSDRLFKERLSYVLDEIDKRNIKQDK